MENRRTANIMESIRKSPLVRILMMGFLVLLLHIPTTMIQGVIGERQTTRREAVEEVTGKWGRSQILIGPSITVPFIKKWTEQSKTGEAKTRSEI